MKQEDIVAQFFVERNSKESTIKNYEMAFKYYTKFNNLSMSELLDEADEEEEKGIRWKRCSLKKRLIDFRTYIYSEVAVSTAKLYFNCIRTFYRHFEIEMQSLPYMKSQKGNNIKHDDIPTKEEIRKAYGFASPLLKAVILFISSSGCGRTETLNLTIEDFMKATNEFSENEDILGRCLELEDVEDAIPIWEVHRQKTDKDYFTFCSPEATQEICKYLLSRKDELNTQKKLFKIEKKYLNRKFREINELLGGESSGAWTKFRPHMLRKFNASALINAETPFTIDEVDAIQGRSKDMTHRTYFLEDPAKLREKYKVCLSAVTILSDVTAFEYQNMKNQKEELESKISEQEEKLRVMMEEMEKISSILNVE